MKIITVSREFGSGGRELAKRLADQLGYDYYDNEIITAIANSSDMVDGDAEFAVRQHSQRSVPLTFRHSFASASKRQSAQTNLLLAQKRVIEAIGKLGKDCVIVGRNADVILQDAKPFNIFVWADMEAKVRRCTERSSDSEHLSRNQIELNIRRIDKTRAYTREVITGKKWGDRSAYQLTVDTSHWSIKDLTPLIADLALRWFEQNS